MKYALLIFIAGLMTVSSLRGQFLSEHDYWPWPYDTIGYFHHHTGTPEQDSTLDQFQIYTLNDEGYVERVLVMGDSAGMDTLLERFFFRDTNQQDTLETGYGYYQGNRFLLFTRRRSFHPNGLVDSVVAENYGSTPPHTQWKREVIRTDTSGNILASSTYELVDSVLKLIRYEERAYLDGLLTLRSRYWDFGVFPSPILQQQFTRSYTPEGKLLTTAQYRRFNADSSLIPVDSIHSYYDMQGWQINGEQFYWDQLMLSWRLSYQDTIEYFTGEFDKQATRFIIEEDTARLYERLRFIDSDSLLFSSTEEWKDSCQCWVLMITAETIFDELGRQASFTNEGISIFTDEPFFIGHQYTYYGEEPIVKYYRDSVHIFPTASPDLETRTYSLRAGFPITSVAPTPPSLDLFLYPNPSKGRLLLCYPAGQPGTLRIFQPDGRKVLRETLNGAGLWQGDLGHLPAGLYFVEVRSGQQRGVKSLIIGK